MTSGIFAVTDPDLIIINPKRQRKKPINIDDLKDSISRLGLIHPPVVERDMTLVAGERRILACKALGWSSIPIQYTDELEPSILHLIELEENIKREDLTWQERTNAIAEYHDLRGQSEPDWTPAKTAKAIGLHENHVYKNLSVAKAMTKGDDRVTTAPKFSTAAGIVSRANDRLQAAAIEAATSVDASNRAERQGTVAAPTEPPAESILNVSFLDWAPTYSGPRFNFIHCDFPYGINADKHVQGAAGLHGGYEDSPDTYWSLLRVLAENIDRLALPSCHLMFWFSMKSDECGYTKTLEFFDEFTPFEINRLPLVWHKTDNSGIIPDAERGPRQVYETALFGSRGDRKIVRAKSNAYGAPSLKDIHMSIKPQPMLAHFMEMFVDESTSLLDPTCGSGSALRAAESLKAQSVLGLEMNPTFAEAARVELSKSRRLRGKA